MKSVLLFILWIGVAQSYYGWEKADLAAAVAADIMPVNDSVTQQTIKETICTHGWTKTVRPPVTVTNEIKQSKLKARGEPSTNDRLYELDHIIPLELGGSPADIRNLQLQLWPEAHQKDMTENCLKETVCRGALSLDEARRHIWEDWHEAREHCAPGTVHPWQYQPE